jgi:hypothetical protein
VRIDANHTIDALVVDNIGLLSFSLVINLWSWRTFFWVVIAVRAKERLDFGRPIVHHSTLSAFPYPNIIDFAETVSILVLVHFFGLTRTRKSSITRRFLQFLFAFVFAFHDLVILIKCPLFLFFSFPPSLSLARSLPH